MMDGMERTLGALIAARLAPNTRLTAKDLADRIGRSPSYVSQLVNDQKSEAPPPDVMLAIERELGIPITTQLRAWGYPIPEGPAPTYADFRLQELIDAWPDMTPEAQTHVHSLLRVPGIVVRELPQIAKMAR
jgi:transcriptional regulator with XRE-family HTH domain